MLLWRDLSLTPGACALGFQPELLLPLLNQQEVGRIVEITDNYKLFCSRAVEIDAFLASFDKSKGITSCRRQFPEGYVFRSRAW